MRQRGYFRVVTPRRMDLIGRIALVAGGISVVLLVVWWSYWYRDGVNSLWLYSAFSAVAAALLGAIAVARRWNGRKPVAAGVGLVLGALVPAYFVDGLLSGAD